MPAGRKNTLSIFRKGKAMYNGVDVLWITMV